ncbi:cytochrome c oxidase subunit 3 [Pseudonocardia pini]|uniref:cytochrome c oxidase subunit 3 n=1 Tax=Pseudonocardia pini TaxID=2758030 RepID=UPI0015F0BD6E|nr:cytochrome c oxidase subunit 3 [Pseudonocardia pini]
MGTPEFPEFLRPGGAITGPRPGAARSAPPGGHPVELGLWLFILGDLTLFGLFFCGQLAERRSDPELFRAAASVLNQTFGTVNTVVLLTSSLTVALASDAIRRQRNRRAAALLGAGLALALTFAVLKVTEYTHLVADGHTPDESVAFVYYFTLTGIHLLHLLIGTVLLSLLLRRVLVLGSDQPVGRSFAEAVAVYWHMVDLLWIVLFALLYLVAGS